MSDSELGMVQAQAQHGERKSAGNRAVETQECCFCLVESDGHAPLLACSFAAPRLRGFLAANQGGTTSNRPY